MSKNRIKKTGAGDATRTRGLLRDYDLNVAPEVFLSREKKFDHLATPAYRKVVYLLLTKKLFNLLLGNEKTNNNTSKHMKITSRTTLVLITSHTLLVLRLY